MATPRPLHLCSTWLAQIKSTLFSVLLARTGQPPHALWAAHAASALIKLCSPLVRALPLTCLLLRGHTTVPVGGQCPRRRADAVVGARSVHALAVFTVGRVLALVHVCREDRGSVRTSGLSPLPPLTVWLSLTCYRDCHTLLLVVIWSPGVVAVAVEGAFGVDAVAVGAQGLVVAFVHICKQREGGGKKIRGYYRTAPPTGQCPDIGFINKTKQNEKRAAVAACSPTTQTQFFIIIIS